MLNTKKIIIDGGDNCYCCACGGLCDRAILEEDCAERTLKYIDSRGVCLGKHCRKFYRCDDGTELERDCSGKWDAWRDGQHLNVVVRGAKWGKDCEYGTRGVALYATKEEWESGRVALRDCETKEPTGWTLITK